MPYKFRSKASGDVIMLQAHGDALLRLLGREPAPKGIFETAHQPALVARAVDSLKAADDRGVVAEWIRAFLRIQP